MLVNLLKFPTCKPPFTHPSITLGINFYYCTPHVVWLHVCLPFSKLLKWGLPGRRRQQRKDCGYAWRRTWSQPTKLSSNLWVSPFPEVQSNTYFPLTESDKTSHTPTTTSGRLIVLGFCSLISCWYLFMWLLLVLHVLSNGF